jgi:RNA polymerase sigma factor (sigma-70 family)
MSSELLPQPDLDEEIRRAAFTIVNCYKRFWYWFADHEEALSIAYMAVARAMKLWREDGGTTWMAYALRGGKLAYLNKFSHERRHARSMLTPDYRNLEMPSVPCHDSKRDDCETLCDLLMHKLPDREYDILIRRAAGETLDAIGKTMGLSRARIQQLEVRAMGKARRVMAGAMTRSRCVDHHDLF